MLRFIINTYSHGFTIRAVYTNDKEVLLSYCHGLATFDYIWSPKFHRKIRTPTAIYATASNDRMEYGFLLAELPDLLKHIKEKGYQIEDISVIDHTPIEGDPIDVKLMPGVGPRDEEQENVLQFITEPDVKNRVLNLRTGSGKAQPLHSKIKTPSGWKTMGEMNVGDVVTAWDGTESKVVGVYPQGLRDVYRVTFRDGRSVEADADHLWEVYQSKYRSFEGDPKRIYPWTKMTTVEIKKYLESEKHLLGVPLILPPVTEDVPLQIDPYLLGVILGDGTISKSTVMITKNDEFIYTEIAPYLDKLDLKISMYTPDDRCMGARLIGNVHRENKMIAIFQSMGLSGCRSHEKFIPNEYLEASFNQRLSLLQGLLDTDGTTNIFGSVSYSTSSYRLALEVQYLVRSLGGIAYMGTKIPTYTYKGEKLEGRISYRINIRYGKPNELFRMPRKRDLLRGTNQYSKSLKLHISSVEYVGAMPTQCISIDHPDHLYITDDFTVTHNTAMGLMAIAHFKVRTALVMSAGYIEIWLKSIGWVLGFDKKDVCVIRGYDDLHTIIGLGLSGNNPYKLIFFSITTLRNWIRDYQNTGEDIAGVTPRTLYEALGIGLRIIDEAHENPHALTIQNINANVARSLYLSATLVSSDPFVVKQYVKLYPYADRFKLGTNNTHVEVYAAFYTLDNPSRVKCTGSKGYSHIAYEQWMMKNPNVFGGYYELLKRLMDTMFIDRYKPKQKALVFCSTVAFCERIANLMREDYKDLGFTVSDYVAKHDESVLYENDIVVTTHDSAGTGKDIPNLAFCLVSTSVGSEALNLQMLGRPRPLPKEYNEDPRFMYMVCRSIPKQLEYHQRRMTYFKHKSKFVKEYETHFVI